MEQELQDEKTADKYFRLGLYALAAKQLEEYGRLSDPQSLPLATKYIRYSSFAGQLTDSHQRFLKLDPSEYYSRYYLGLNSYCVNKSSDDPKDALSSWQEIATSYLTATQSPGDPTNTAGGQNLEDMLPNSDREVFICSYFDACIRMQKQDAAFEQEQSFKDGMQLVATGLVPTYRKEDSLAIYHRYAYAVYHGFIDPGSGNKPEELRKIALTLYELGMDFDSSDFRVWATVYALFDDARGAEPYPGEAKTAINRACILAPDIEILKKAKEKVIAVETSTT